MMESGTLNLSVVICTYNPDREVFTRVMDSISALQRPKEGFVEFILVDNNSTFSLTEMDAVDRFLRVPNARLVKETKQGHAFARQKGIKEAKYEVVVFFDDDNEPPSDYLLQMASLFQAFPNVGVWGPGRVEVMFFGQVPAWIPFNKGEFQAKNLGIRQFACVKDWLSMYPPGTGFAVRTSVLKNYLQQCETGMYTDAGRTGGATSSAEDVQIVFEAVKMGFAAGTDPSLSINHLIIARKATYQYLKKLRFGMSSAFAKAYCECFPEDAPVINPYRLSEIVGLVWTAFYVSIIRRKSPRFFAFEMATVTGKLAGRFIKGAMPYPVWLRWLIGFQHLK